MRVDKLAEFCHPNNFVNTNTLFDHQKNKTTTTKTTKIIKKKKKEKEKKPCTHTYHQEISTGTKLTISW